MIMIIKMIMIMIIKHDNNNVNDITSSIDIEVIRTVLYFLLKYFAQTKNTQALFKYLNTPKKT